MKGKRWMKQAAAAILMLILSIGLITGCAGAAGRKGSSQQQTSRASSTRTEQQTSRQQEESEILEEETYTSKEEVAEYLYLYEHLPDNYITKKEAKDLGWDSRDGNLWEVAPGKSIGGDRFGNREELLPIKSGRKYYECDIDYEGGYRNSKRIIYSNDGLIYYTEDHYNTFEQLYDEEGEK